MDNRYFLVMYCFVSGCVYRERERDAPMRIVLTLYIMVRTFSRPNLCSIRTVHTHRTTLDNTKSRELTPDWTIGLRIQFFISYKGINFMGPWIRMG